MIKKIEVTRIDTMKLTKILSVVAVAAVLTACAGPAGELVGVNKAGDFKEANPYGMVFIKKGSFMMGENSQSAIFGQPDNPFMTTVNAFWMDETEITNNEYKQFVNYVRDSIAYYHLILGPGMGGGDEEEEDYEEGGNADLRARFAIEDKRARQAEEEEEYEEEEEGAAKRVNFRINWKAKIPWNSKDPNIRRALAPMYYSDGSLRTIDLHYRYGWRNYDQARLLKNKFDVAKGRYPDGASARVDTFWIDEKGEICNKTIVRPLREPDDLMTYKIISIYPDTMIWIRDFQFAFNDPMMKGYFNFIGYTEYPVVGVTWEQAHAFCHWRTKMFQDQYGKQSHDYRLPTEAEWEYAARGGRKMAMYPWGGNYARDANGCFLANFKPYRGAYNDDTGTMTMRVAQFRPNDFGLFDMAGNVAEWTSSAFNPSTNTYVNDINSNFEYMARKDDPDILKCKVVKGGSWKDIYYYLQCGVRTYEYQYESRAYIGFRCVRSFLGD